MEAMRAAKVPVQLTEGPGATEAAILEALEAGDAATAFERLRIAYARRGYGLARRLVRDAALAEDVMQEALLQVFQGLGALRQRGSLHAWVMTVIAHRALDQLRKRSRRHGHEVELAEPLDPPGGDGASPGGGAPPEMMMAVEEVHALELGLRSLSPKVRAVVLLRFGHDCTFDEIGALLGEQSDTVRVRVMRALPRLRARLHQLGIARLPSPRPRPALRSV